jgi:hypothetical protein
MQARAALMDDADAAPPALTMTITATITAPLPGLSQFFSKRLRKFKFQSTYQLFTREQFDLWAPPRGHGRSRGTGKTK